MPGENKIEQNPVVSPEQVNVDKKLENISEPSLERLNDKIETVKASDLIKEKKAPVTSLPPVRAINSNYQQQQLQAIEEIMSSGLDKAFLQMKPDEQRRFKEEGEKTATKISALLDKAKVGMDKIISLIKRWLGLLPQTNKFFLEQEAKIKADKILKIKKNL